MTEPTRFPSFQAKDDEDKRDLNLAIRLFGNRFYRDQAVVEYLAELLLVLASEKRVDGQDTMEMFPPAAGNAKKELAYLPAHGVPLKLLAFFATSKLETRHESHRDAFESGLSRLQEVVKAPTDADKQDFVSGLRSLLNGFVGVAGNRTWVTQTFLPVSRALLAREVMWTHSKARHVGREWGPAAKLFHVNGHNFFARGGEHLYLQLAQLFQCYDAPVLVEMRARAAYAHLPANGDEFKEQIVAGFTNLFDELEPSLGRLANFASNAMGHEISIKHIEDSPANFGWIPASCLPEAMLFAWELLNLLHASLDPLKRVEYLQMLCALHPLRTMAFQAARYVPTPHPVEFIGQYVWVVAPHLRGNDELKKLAERNYQRVEQLLQQAIRTGNWPGHQQGTDKGIGKKTAQDGQKEWDDADAQAHHLLRRLGKAIGLVIPPRGPGARFNLPHETIRMLVPALLPAGQRLSEAEFLRRMYFHYGIVLGGDRAAEAATWTMPDVPLKSNWEEPHWFTEALRAGGYLIPLSDAVSMVQNPHL